MNDLAGRLQLRPGAPVPHNLRSTRRAWASRIAPGRPADGLPGLLAGLFSLCSHAHRTASQLALHALEPSRVPCVDTVPTALQRETALEHLRRIGLDWPRLLADPADAAAPAARAADGLRTCPLWETPSDPACWQRTARWLQVEWLGMPAADWLQAWEAGEAAWLDDWSRHRPGWLPSLLRAVKPLDTDLPAVQATALRPHGHEGSLRRLGASLALQPDVALRPRWEGQVACTGPWARGNADGRGRPSSAWGLLGSRLAELVRLCLPDAPGATGAGWLGWGSLPTGPRQALAWVEMARGLLIHQVSLDEAAPGAPPTVRACQVLAPTEWNFHPEGVAAQALASLPAEAPDLRARVRLLMAALDPCVPFDIVMPTGQDERLEVHHA